jgi:hypothetical protein
VRGGPRALTGIARRSNLRPVAPYRARPEPFTARILDRVERVRAKLRALGFIEALRPIFSPERLEAFEEAHHFTFPVDYRAAVTQLGNGARDPYGFFSIEDALRWRPSNPALPSPLDPEADYWAIWDADPDPERGLLPFQEYGCGTFTGFVVTGKAERGRNPRRIRDGPPCAQTDRFPSTPMARGE